MFKRILAKWFLCKLKMNDDSIKVKKSFGNTFYIT